MQTKEKQSYYTMPFYKKIGYNIKNYFINKKNEFKFPLAQVIFLVLIVLVFLSIVLIIKANQIDIIPRAPYSKEGFEYIKEARCVTSSSDKEVCTFKKHQLENERFEFNFDEKTTHFEIFDKSVGTTFSSNPLIGETAFNDVFTLMYASNRGLEKTFGSQSKSVDSQRYYIKIKDTKEEQSIELIYVVGYVGIVKEDFPKQINETQRSEILTLIENNSTDKSFLTTFKAAYRITNRVVDGQKIYDRDIYDNTFSAKKMYEIFYNVCGYDKLKVQEINSMFGIEETKDAADFEVGIKYTLLNDRFEAKIINDAIVENVKYPIIGINFLPYFNAGSEKSEGYMMIPDGSGVLINFNNNKLDSKAYDKRIYGTDSGIKKNYLTESYENINMPLFGIKNGNATMLAVLNKGAEMSNIFAKSQSNNYKCNNANFKFYFREGLEYKFPGWNVTQEVVGWTKSYITEDYVVDYYFLEDQSGYVEMANKARDIFLKDKEDKEQELELDINVLGAYKRKKSIMGFPVTDIDSLTNYQEVEELIRTFEGLGPLNIYYEGMFNDGLTHYAIEQLKVISSMGSKKDLLNLAKYQGEVDLYPSLNLVSTYTDKKFNAKKYGVRDPFSDIVKQYPFDEPTNVSLKGKDPYYTIKGSLIKEYNENFLKSYSQFGFKNLNILDIGNRISGSYRNKDTEFRDESLQNYLEVLKNLNQNELKLSSQNPSIYMFQYLSEASGIPSNGTLYTIVDEIIPFYQLVISGKVNYSSKPINMEDQYSWEYHKLKLIETGSNLNFTLSFDNTDKLIKTDFNYYLSCYYKFYIEKITTLYQELDQIGYSSGHLIGHEILEKDVVKVTYSNGKEIILNYTSKPYGDIEALSYKVTERAD